MSRPDPNELLTEVDELPQKIRGLRAYRTVIQRLKDEKDYTFREIAEFLQERGLDIDHNGVYRQYSAGMPKNAAIGAEVLDEEREEELEKERILDEET